QVEHDDFKLSELVQHVRDLYQPLAEQKGIGLILTIHTDCQVRTDRDKLSQILKNIVNNAVKFTTKGQVEISLSSIKDHPEGEYCISIKDTGIGIPKESLSNIFERFQQADHKISSEFGGTGLGLAICQKLAQLLDITITVDSVVNQGSTFTLYIHSPRQVEHRVFNSGKSVLDDMIDDDSALKDLTIAI